MSHDLVSEGASDVVSAAADGVTLLPKEEAVAS